MNCYTTLVGAPMHPVKAHSGMPLIAAIPLRSFSPATVNFSTYRQESYPISGN